MTDRSWITMTRSWISKEIAFWELNPLNTTALVDVAILFVNSELLDLKRNGRGNSLRTNEIWPNPGDPAKIFQLRPQKCSKSGQTREIKQSNFSGGPQNIHRFLVPE